jgi:type IV pilus assembly protein PilN
VSSEINYQNSRNAHLQKNINELNRQVKKIKELEKKKKKLLDRMKVIQELQGNRPIIVRIFDEMVRTLPDGVFYKSLDRAGSSVSLDGSAESNNRISSLMRNLQSSEWFTAPNLSAVTSDPKLGEQASSFKLSFNISTPSASNKGNN